MTTAKSCISAVFAASKPGASAGPSRWVVTRYLSVLVQMWVMRSAKSSVPGDPRYVPVSFWLLYPQNGAPMVSTCRSGFRARQRGGVVGEGRRRVELGRGDRHRPGETVGSGERQRHITLSGLTRPAVGSCDGDPRCGRIGNLSDGADADPGGLRKACECVGRHMVRQRGLDPGNRCAVAHRGLRRCRRRRLAGPGRHPVGGPDAPGQRRDRRQAGRSQRDANPARRRFNHAKRPAPVLFPRLHRDDRTGRWSPGR